MWSGPVQLFMVQSTLNCIVSSKALLMNPSLKCFILLHRSPYLNWMPSICLLSEILKVKMEVHGFPHYRSFSQLPIYQCFSNFEILLVARISSCAFAQRKKFISTKLKKALICRSRICKTLLLFSNEREEKRSRPRPILAKSIHKKTKFAMCGSETLTNQLKY